MGLYENGIDTRKAILNACTALFFEKGYHGTSIDEICQTAHVNRGSIYYHFKDKENIRYEVLWNTIMDNVSQVRGCEQPIPQKYEYLMAMYLLWQRVLGDENVRRFCVEYFKDYPVYSPKENLSRSVTTLVDHINHQILPGYDLDRLGMASVYGFIMSITLLSQKTEFPPDALLHQVFLISNLIRGVAAEEVSREWMTFSPFVGQFART